MIIANVIGVFLFFYLLWRTLKDDYHYEKIFNLAFFIVIGLLIGFTVSKFLFKDYWFWLILSGIFTGFVISIIRQKMKFFESFEALVISLLPWISFVYLADSINRSNLLSFIAFWVSAVCVALFFFFKSYYRTFTWYKSGRVGFAGLLTSVIFFASRILNFHEYYVSGILTVVFFLLLYKLSISKE
jgi:hypothetical protein